MGYSVPAREARFAQEIKRSRFIGVAIRVSSSEDATEALAALKKEFPDATHHCWAYVLGNPASSSHMRTDDDGEPSGTAGKPILNVLQHQDVGDILLVVVRYFGGTKLGAGGLVRAYSSTASGVMERLDVVPNTPLREARLEVLPDGHGRSPARSHEAEERSGAADSLEGGGSAVLRRFSGETPRRSTGTARPAGPHRESAGCVRSGRQPHRSRQELHHAG